MRKKVVKPKNGHPEAKGLAYICISLLLFTSLLSFEYQNPDACYLGLAGYWSAFCFLYIFGLGSYLLTGFLGYCGVQFLLQKDRVYLHPMYFTIDHR